MGKMGAGTVPRAWECPIQRFYFVGAGPRCEDQFLCRQAAEGGGPYTMLPF